MGIASGEFYFSPQASQTHEELLASNPMVLWEYPHPQAPSSHIVDEWYPQDFL